jgi:hypothetical protein
MIIRDPLGLVLALTIWSIVDYMSYWTIKDSNRKEEELEDYEPF